MRILALDLGTSTGWAFSESKDGIPAYGLWNLQPSRHEDAGMRWIKLRNSLDELYGYAQGRFLDLIVYEEVAAHKGTVAAHIYGGLVAILQSWCKEHDIRYTGVPVGTIKKHATGKGNAGKDTMIARANEAFKFLQKPLEEKADDIADALWILDWAVKEYNK